MFIRRSRRLFRGVALWMIVSFLGSTVRTPAQWTAPTPGMPAPPSAPPSAAPSALPVPPAPAEDLTDIEGEAITPADGGSVPEPPSEKLLNLNFRDAPLDQVLQFYADITGRTLIKSPGINATITLRGQTRLTQTEALQAIESVLAMNNVTLVPMGAKFLKVVQPTSARQEGMSISKSVPEKGFPETDHLISQIVTLKFIELAEAQTIIQSFLHGYGKIQALERTNSMLITDTAANLQRIMEILEYLDQPTETKVETRVYELVYAEAGKVASRLNELIQDAQAKEEKPKVAAPAPAVPAPAGVIRARATPAQPEPTSEAAMEQALAERGIVQGKVKIVADDRTNILIVISRPSNFTFFDKIVAILDRPVNPDVIVRVAALEYAEAEQIAGILNEFIGAAKADTATAGAAAAGAAAGQAAEGSDARSAALQEYVARQAESRLREVASSEKAKIGQLSPNTKILADKRTNSLLLMGTKSDIAAIEEVIDKLDIMLAQVLIEAVILEVKLSKGVQYGVDWLQKSMTVYSTRNVNGLNVRDPMASYGGGWSSTSRKFTDASTIDRTTEITQGLTYFLTLFDLNIDAVLRMLASSSDARVLSTPVILTTDNTEAQINSSEQRPVVTQTSTTDAGAIRSSYEYRDIGIKLKVKPHINPQRFVVLDVTQTADTPGDDVLIDGNKVPSIFKRELSASIAVQDRSTIVLGGLVQSDAKRSRTKVPILGDIPILGTLFRSDDHSKNRTELLVLLTPYVLMTPDEAIRETRRLHHESTAGRKNWERGWSDSELATKTRKYNRSMKALEEKELKAAEEKALKQQEKDHRLPTGPYGAETSGVQTTPRITVVRPSDVPLNEEVKADERGPTWELQENVESAEAAPAEEPAEPGDEQAAADAGPEAAEPDEPVKMPRVAPYIDPKTVMVDEALTAPVPMDKAGGADVSKKD